MICDDETAEADGRAEGEDDGVAHLHLITVLISGTDARMEGERGIIHVSMYLGVLLCMFWAI